MYQKQKYLLLKKLTSTGLYAKLKNTHAVIAGGAVRAVFANEAIQDYDIYFKKEEDLLSFNSKINEENSKYKLVYETNCAKTYKNSEITIQIITMPDLICVDPKGIIDQFDYTICMGLFDFDTEEFLLNENFLVDLARKELTYNTNGKYPLASLFRLKKYTRIGYSISGTEIIKLGLAINNLKMKDYRDLKVQLQGIDTIFLKELTDKLMTPEYAEKEYDFTTFVEMINQHFAEQLDELFS